MKYWWRIYAHLAPLLPGTLLVERVRHKAVSDHPEPEPAKLTRGRQSNEIFQDIFAADPDDGPKLDILCAELFHEIVCECMEKYGHREDRILKYTLRLLVPDTFPQDLRYRLRSYPGPIPKRIK